ncbi:MAG TPA: 1,4-dihydroxy-2-naphthoate polyprenyltransferase [Thermoanaerobaculia bacterium]|nr:1,4-dihydroxy-2-naphthoate polyprenyltransferase [Thermoanaerobaculia bacterium]
MIRNWLLAARPKTLSAAVVPVMLGLALAPRPIHIGLAACTLFGALLIQVATNFINDALDFKKGADTTERLGPVRVTQAGLISAEAVMRAAYVCFGLAALCGIPLIMRGGWPLLAIGVASILCSYIYTGGPYPLAYNGLGELFVMIFFGFVAVAGTYYVQALTIDRAVILSGYIAGALATVLLVINNLRDVESDRASNKKTMVVRLGEGFARFEIAFFAFTPFIAQLFVAGARNRSWLLLPLGAAFIALELINRIRRSHGRELNRFLAMAGALQWAFGILFVIGSLIG